MLSYFGIWIKNQDLRLSSKPLYYLEMAASCIQIDQIFNTASDYVFSSFRKWKTVVWQQQQQQNSEKIGFLVGQVVL